MLSPRYRVVNFRLSSEEYESVFVSCVNEGFRTISEFARSAVLDQVQARALGTPVLGDQLAALSSTLEEAVKNIRELKEESRKVAAQIEAQSKAKDGV